MFSLLNVVMASDSFFGTLLPEVVFSDVGLSNADKQLRSVVFPEPDGPKYDSFTFIYLQISPSELLLSLRPFGSASPIH